MLLLLIPYYTLFFFTVNGRCAKIRMVALDAVVLRNQAPTCRTEESILGIVSATDSVGLRVLFISIVGLVALVLLLVITVALYLVGQLALRELVIGGRGIFSAIGGGYRLFRRNLGRTIVVWLIQFAIALAVTAVLFVVTFVIGIAQTAGFFALSSAAPYPLVVGVAVVVGLIVSLPLILFAAIFGVFNHAYWTLAYLQLTVEQPPRGEYSPSTSG